jgi:hypothetical protein
MKSNHSWKQDLKKINLLFNIMWSKLNSNKYAGVVCEDKKHSIWSQVTIEKW